MKAVAPQTGNAVEGFCPNAVQVCDHPPMANTLHNIKTGMIFPTFSITVKVFHSFVGPERIM